MSHVWVRVSDQPDLVEYVLANCKGVDLDVLRVPSNPNYFMNFVMFQPMTNSLIIN